MKKIPDKPAQPRATVTHLPSNLHRAMKEYADERGMRLSAVVAEVVRLGMKQKRIPFAESVPA